jgi:hypothetical protein
LVKIAASVLKKNEEPVLARMMYGEEATGYPQTLREKTCHLSEELLLPIEAFGAGMERDCQGFDGILKLNEPALGMAGVQ